LGWSGIRTLLDASFIILGLERQLAVCSLDAAFDYTCCQQYRLQHQRDEH
jgi:hypothetical protein